MGVLGGKSLSPVQVAERRIAERGQIAKGHGARPAEIDGAFAVRDLPACDEKMREQNVRNAPVVRFVAHLDPAERLFGVALLRLVLFETRLVRIGQRVDVHALPRRVLDDDVVFPRLHGLYGAVSPYREPLPFPSEDIDAVLGGERGGSRARRSR